ncbi:serine/threonine protein kinase [Spirochaetia bacterium]|nr:serine/threonine protein kinase [Spirochaetia bacterium]
MKLLLKNKIVYRAELARITKLSIPTIMKITNDFINRGIAFNAGKGVSSGGKPPDLIQIIPNACFFLGVDISINQLKCVIINLSGEVIIQIESPNPAADNARGAGDIIMNVITTLIQRAGNHSGLDEDRLMGIGISVPFPVDTRGGKIIYAPEIGWVDFPLADRLTGIFHLPVFLENKAKVLAMRAKWFGNVEEHPSFLLVVFGRGIGSAIILNGGIYKGVNNLSGEIGHTVIKTDGPLCKCGNHGCLEAIASVPVLVNNVIEELKEGRESILRDEAENIANLTLDDILKAVRNGDSLACDALNEFVKNVSVGITNVVNILDINLVFLSGDIINKRPELVEETRRTINKRRHRYLEKDIAVEVLRFDQDAAAIGAATLPLNEMIENGVMLTRNSITKI